MCIAVLQGPVGAAAASFPKLLLLTAQRCMAAAAREPMGLPGLLLHAQTATHARLLTALAASPIPVPAMGRVEVRTPQFYLCADHLNQDAAWALLLFLEQGLQYNTLRLFICWLSNQNYSRKLLKSICCFPHHTLPASYVSADCWLCCRA